MVSGGFALSCLVLDFPRKDRCSDVDWWSTVRGLESALKTNRAKGAIVASLPENIPEEYMAGLMAQGIAPLCGITEAFDAAEAAAFIGKAWKMPPAVPVVAPEIRGAEERAPDEAQAKAILANHGLPVPPGRRCQTVDAAVAAAQDLTFPVALKALGVAHKSELNAVRLNLRDADAVRAAATDLIAIGSGLYVERMVTDAVAELIVGIVDDPQFGPLMTLGTGWRSVALSLSTLSLPRRIHFKRPQWLSRSCFSKFRAQRSCSGNDG